MSKFYSDNFRINVVAIRFVKSGIVPSQLETDVILFPIQDLNGTFEPRIETGTESNESGSFQILEDADTLPEGFSGIVCVKVDFDSHLFDIPGKKSRLQHLRNGIPFGEFNVHLENVDDVFAVQRMEHLVDGSSRFHVPVGCRMDPILSIQTHVIEMDFFTPVVIFDSHGWIEGVDLTSELGHGIVERPLIVDAEGINQTTAVNGADIQVETDGFVAIRCGCAASTVDPEPEIDSESTRRAICPVQVLKHLYWIHFRCLGRGLRWILTEALWKKCRFQVVKPTSRHQDEKDGR